jgi:hypothetical protein
MYVRRKVFSNVEQPVEEQLYSVTMTEEQYNLFSEFLEEREFTTWQDAAGNVWQDDLKTGKPKMIQSAAEAEAFDYGKAKGKFGKQTYEGSTGGEAHLPKKAMTDAEKKAFDKQNKEAIKAAKKEAGAKWKAEHSKENMKKVNSGVAKVKAQLAENAANRSRIASKAAAAEKARLLKKAGKIGGGVAAAGALGAAGIYGYKKVADKA